MEKFNKFVAGLSENEPIHTAYLPLPFDHNIAGSSKENSFLDLLRIFNNDNEASPEDPKCVFVVFHTKAAVSAYKGDFDYHLDHDEHYSNDYLDSMYGGRPIGHISKFSETNSRFVFMTYDKLCKILMKIHTYALSKERSGAIKGSGILLASHIILVDPWHVTMASSAAIHIWKKIIDYGVGFPRLVLISSGPKITFDSDYDEELFSEPRNFLEPKRFEISIRQLKSSTKTSQTFINDLFKTFAVEFEEGENVVVFVPSIKLKSRIMRTNVSSGITVYSDLNLSMSLKAVHRLYIIPYVFNVSGTPEVMPFEVIQNIINSVFNPKYTKLDVIIYGGHELSNNQLKALSTTKFAETLSIQGKTKELFGNMKNKNIPFIFLNKLMINGNIEPYPYMKDVKIIEKLEDAGYISTQKVKDNPYHISLIKYAAIFANYNALSHWGTIMRDRWFDISTSVFPFYVFYFIFQRYEMDQDPLINFTQEVINVKYRLKINDPLEYQMQAIVDFITKTRFETVLDDEYKNFAEEYSLDPSVLKTIYIKILKLIEHIPPSLGSCGAFPVKLVLEEISRDNIFNFPALKYSKGADAKTGYYTDPNNLEVKYVIDEKMGFTPDSNILLLHCQENTVSMNMYNTNDLQVSNITLYMARSNA
jgi:hypothetical protein